MLQLPLTAKSRRNSSRLVGSVAGLAAFVALTGKAQARSDEGASDGLVALTDLPNVASVELRDDGSVLIRFEDGSARILSAGEVIVENGVVYLDPAAQAEMALEGGTAIVLAGLGVAAVAGVVALSSDGGDQEPALPVNTAPTITSAAAISVAENNTVTGLSVAATDAERDNVSFAIVGGADAARFAVDPVSGALRFITAPDFEVPGDANGDNVFEVQVAATDGTLRATQTILVTVTNANEAPVITSASAVTVTENSTAVVQATATDVDSAMVTFSLSGTDAALFAIDAATGVITFIGAPDFEDPDDADGNNVYQLVLTASDGVNSTTQNLAVTVANANDVAPVITSDATVSVQENGTAVTQVVATDAEGDTITYSLSGADAALFAINAGTGVITFVAAPDFEMPGDADADNAYQITVTANDGANSTTQDLTVTVTNANDVAPVITSGAAVSVQENGTAVTQIAANDAEGDTITFSLSGADAALFAINATSGIITFVAAPDFEMPGDADANNAYQITVTANDGANSTTQDLTVSVTDQNEVVGTAGDDMLMGSTGDDVIDGLQGNDEIDSLAGTDLVTGGAGADDFLFDLNGVDDGLTEDSITDFAFTEDRFVLDNASFNVPGPLVFMAVDGNTAAPDSAAGANVIVLLNSDDDADPATPFNARSAARQIDDLVDLDGPGFFVYSNSALGVNRLVYSENLNDGEAPLQVVARLTDLTGQDAIDALADFSANNFVFQEDMPPVMMLTQGDVIGLPGEFNMAPFVSDAPAEGASLTAPFDLVDGTLGDKELAAVAQLNADALTGGV